MIAMVSSIRYLQLGALNCNLGAAVLIAVLAAPAAADQAAPPAAAQPNEQRALDTVKFLAGGVTGLFLHESGHLVFDVAFDAEPHVGGIRFGVVPFFAIEHRADLSPRREFIVSSAGFWVQEAGNEWLLTRRPSLRREHAPFTKGIFAFNVLTSVGYAVVAFARAGPAERDTRSMAAASGIDEPAVGAFVLAPAILDGWRYFAPDARWAVWASRAAKVAGVVLAIKRPPQD
jgi:hypothetical protein